MCGHIVIGGSEIWIDCQPLAAQRDCRWDGNAFSAR